jgi:hypothetical protein
MHIPHELPEEFREDMRFIERLAKSDYQFRQLTTEYDEVNRHIYRIESEDEPTTDEVLEDLKDEIASALRKLERRM